MKKLHPIACMHFFILRTCLVIVVIFWFLAYLLLDIFNFGYMSVCSKCMKEGVYVIHLISINAILRNRNIGLFLQNVL